MKAVTLLGVAAALIVGYVGYLFVQAQLLEYRFREIHPDESEVQLLKVVGAPTAIRRCDEGRHKIVNDDKPEARRCARVYWYKPNLFSDEWLVPIDETGYVMQIKRLGLP